MKLLSTVPSETKMTVTASSVVDEKEVGAAMKVERGRGCCSVLLATACLLLYTCTGRALSRTANTTRCVNRASCKNHFIADNTGAHIWSSTYPNRSCTRADFVPFFRVWLY